VGSISDDPADPELAELRERFVLFTVGATRCVFRMEDVRQVIVPQAITRVPRVPSYILGVTNLRGRILPVVDLCARLKIQETPVAKPRIVVTQVEDMDVGYLVGGLLGSVYYSESQIRPAPAVEGTIPRDNVRGIVSEPDGEMTILLDLETMIAADRQAIVG